MFKLISSYKPKGDQPQAIEKLTKGLNKGFEHQTLLGVTGSGKTFTMASVIEKVNRPTLVISHNKTLAAQLFQEFREFFPENSVNYFVSYYDYYMPESYIPQTDTYIEKETEINEEIDKLRLAATTALMTRKDVVVVASVSCIYNLGSPVEYGKFILPLSIGQAWQRTKLLYELARLQYDRNEMDFKRGTYRVRGENVEVYPAYESNGLRIEFIGEKIKAITSFEPVTGNTHKHLEAIVLYPAKHYVTSEDVLKGAIEKIEKDLETRVEDLKKQGKMLEAHRIRQKTKYDIEQMLEFGFCKGIENYSRYFDGRKPGEPPFSLLDYFPKDYLCIIDESHMTIPQIRGMYNGDQSRKQTLVDFGFRLPSALDNRPLKYEEFARRTNQLIYTSATPNEFELSLSSKIVEQLIRPTGLIDPKISIRPTKGQIDDLISEVEKTVSKGQRVLVTTLTKRMSEDLSEYLESKKIKVTYLHSEIETLDRTDILDDLRMGKYDVLVGINLLREGLDLPEVSLVAILDADKEGFLRSDTALIQTMGRAARHVEGNVILYADNITGSMRRAMDEVERRRKVQTDFNQKFKIIPKSIEKPVRDKLVDRSEEDQKKLVWRDSVIEEAILRAEEGSLLSDDRQKLIKILTREMKDAARMLDFEKAAALRDQVIELKSYS